MARKRVVITGLSALSPLGIGVKESWNALLEGASGIGPITLFDTTGFDTCIAGEVKGFDAEPYVGSKNVRRMDRFVQFAVAGALQLVPSAEYPFGTDFSSGYTVTDENAARVGVLLGVGLGGLSTIETFHSKLLESGPSRVSPFYIPMLISNMAPGQVSIFTGVKGTNAVLTSACTSSLHAIGYAFLEVALGRQDAMITGGIESTITPMGISGFTSMKALSTKRNNTPEKASRPFDADRDGFVMGEGAGMLFLESLESAKARGATIYAEMIGFGASADAYHMVAPKENGEGMALAMNNALKEGAEVLAERGISFDPTMVTHINAHATSTNANDKAETKAIHDVFGEHAKNIAICANKSQMGHLLGAAGGVESVFSVLSLYTGMVPGTLNLETPDPECDLNYMTTGPKKLDPQYVLCNSFGFGGTNGSLLFRKFEE